MKTNKPKSRQYIQQLQNIAMGLCRVSKAHGKAVEGHKRCAVCLEKNREANRKNQGCSSYAVTGRGRAPIGLPVDVARARKIEKLKKSKDGHLAWIATHAASLEKTTCLHEGWIAHATRRFNKKRDKHQKWIDEINGELIEILGHE